MEQHSVPQNITSFEFRLIGDMTVKQFSFLAAGAVLAWIFWGLPIPSLIRIPLSFLFAFLGVAFAFLPVQDRPLHRWLWAFLKSIYSPSQYLFQKSEKAPLYLTPGFPAAVSQTLPTFQLAESRRKLEEYLKTLPKSLPSALDTQEREALTKIQALSETLATLPTPFPLPSRSHLGPPLPTPRIKIQLRQKVAPLTPPREPVPFPKKKLAFAEEGRLLFEEEKKTLPTIPFSATKIASRSELLVAEIKKLKESITLLKEKPPSPQAPSGERINYEERLAQLERELEEAEQEKENLLQAMLRLRKEITLKPRGVTPKEVLEKTKAVKIISAQAAKEVGLPRLTTTPNVITGVVQDKKGSFLANILAEIKDEEGNSVRAFKTNKLGQFAAATPLRNGTYTIELEDPRGEFVFDIIEVKVEGKVLPPLAIYAKGQTELDKEKIHQSLFGEN